MESGASNNTLEGRPLLFIGASSIEANATQHKLFFLSTELARRGRRVTVCVPCLPDNRRFFEDAHAGVEVVFVPVSGCLAEVVAKHRVVSSRNWAAVHSIGVGARTLLRWRRSIRGAPLLHDFDENMSSIAGLKPLRRIYLKWVESWMLSHAAGFTCASQFLVEWVRTNARPTPVEIHYSPVAISEDEHVVDPELSAKIRHRFPGKRVLIYVGSLTRYYQIDEIVDLAAALKPRRDDLVLLVCGDGPDRADMERASKERGLTDILRFEGRVARKDIASYLDAASVLLFPFHNTRQNVARCPTKAFHYAASGRPLVTNRVGEVAQLFGDSASYYPEGDVAAMADACEKALDEGDGRPPGPSFGSLTWKQRAEDYDQWFRKMGIW